MTSAIRVDAHSNRLRVGAVVGVPVSLEDALACSSPPLQSCLAGHPIRIQSMYIAPYKHMQGCKESTG